MKQQLYSTIIAFVLVQTVFLPCRGDEPVQPLEMNVFLANWQVMGPLPLEGSPPNEIDFQYFPDEATLRPGSVRLYGTEIVKWTKVNTRMVDLRAALNRGGIKGNDRVVFAWTQFTSETDQEVILGVSHDDACIAWLNDTEIVRGQSRGVYSESILDQTTAKVKVRKGVNTLLLKISQRTYLWEYAARFRPVGISNPIVAIKAMPDDVPAPLPVVGIELLDASRRVFARHRCSGSRSESNRSGIWYQLYAKPLDVQPEFVRFTVSESGFADMQRDYTWDDVQSGKAELVFKADPPLTLSIYDKKTGRPIVGARVWGHPGSADVRSDAEGLMVLPDFNATGDVCWVEAAGYVTQKRRLVFPRNEIVKYRLAPGGVTLTGVVSSTDGQPIADATVSISTSGYQTYRPRTVTDENGRFTVAGFRRHQDITSARVSCTGYRTMGIALKLEEGKPTDFKWTLAK